AGPVTLVPTALRLSGTQKSSFCASSARAGLIVMHKNDATPPTFTFDRFAIVSGQPMVARPTVTATRPGSGMTDVSRDGFVAVDVNLPTAGAGIDQGSLSSSTVKLVRTSEGK